MDAKKNSGDDESLRIQSWEDVLQIFQEDISTVHGKPLKYIIEIIHFLKERGYNKWLFASQSHGRLAISSSIGDIYSPYVMVTVTCDHPETIACEIHLPHETGVHVLQRDICSPSQAVDLIGKYVGFLKP